MSCYKKYCVKKEKKKNDEIELDDEVVTPRKVKTLKIQIDSEINSVESAYPIDSEIPLDREAEQVEPNKFKSK